MLWRDLETFLQRIRAAGVSIGDDEAFLVKASLGANTKHRAVMRHDPACELQMRETPPRA